MSQDNARVYVQFVHVSRRFNPVTVAYTASENDNVVTVGFGLSICHKRDRFDRVMGRQIACGRMSRRPSSFTYVRDADLNFNAQLSREVREYVRSVGFPLSFIAAGPKANIEPDNDSVEGGQEVSAHLSQDCSGDIS